MRLGARCSNLKPIKRLRLFGIFESFVLFFLLGLERDGEQKTETPPSVRPFWGILERSEMLNNDGGNKRKARKTWVEKKQNKMRDELRWVGTRAIESEILTGNTYALPSGVFFFSPRVSFFPSSGVSVSFPSSCRLLLGAHLRGSLGSRPKDYC